MYIYFKIGSGSEDKNIGRRKYNVAFENGLTGAPNEKSVGKNNVPDGKNSRSSQNKTPVEGFHLIFVHKVFSECYDIIC